MEFYNTGKWQKKREHILRLDKYKDRVEERYGRAREANLVHHIYPRSLYPEYEWEDWNLISVSLSTHQRLHKKGGDTLSKEGVALMRRTKKGIDWRKKNGTK